MIERDTYVNDIDSVAAQCGAPNIEQACNKLKQLDIPRLYEKGISRSRIQYEFYNQYPSYYLLDQISEERIFAEAREPYIGAERAGAPLALYIHLPFCNEKCTYCCCHSSTSWTRDDISDYIGYLEKEMSLISQKESVRGRKVTTIYIGGGTPTVLLPAQFDRIIKSVRSCFDVPENAGWTTEATPESLSEELLRYLYEKGFRRINIGVQTCDDRLLKTFKRGYRGEDVARILEMTQSIGFKNINVDLIFGLAGQTLDMWSNTIQTIQRLAPANVTFYPFADACAGTIMAKQEITRFPTEIEKLVMHVCGIETFLKAGYHQITPYQFIQSWDYPYAHQEHKAVNGEIYACGATGHSFINGCDYHNVTNVVDYKARLDKGELPIHCGRVLTKKEMMTRFVIYTLQKTSGLNRERGGVDIKEYQKRFDEDVFDVFAEEVKTLTDLGAIRSDGEYIRFTYEGTLYPVETCQCFYSDDEKKKIKKIV